MKILIIEDEEALSKVLQEKFEREKFETKEARDGEVGLSLAKSYKPDIVLLDLVLPKKDGFDVLSGIQADPEMKGLKIIVLSNLGEDENIKRALSLGAIDYFVKSQHPINEIVEKVKSHLTG